MMAKGFMVETICQMAIPLAVIWFDLISCVPFFSLCVFGFIDAPRCKPGTEQSAVGSINMHSIDVRCEVDADPAENIRFSWTYNNTRNVSPVRTFCSAPCFAFSFLFFCCCFDSVPSIINQLNFALVFFSLSFLLGWPKLLNRCWIHE